MRGARSSWMIAVVLAASTVTGVSAGADDCEQTRQRIQQARDTIEVEASVGGGMVTAVMSGHDELLSVRLDQEAIDPDDPGM